MGGITVCFVALIQPPLLPSVYMLPNCDPKLTGTMLCYIDSVSPYSRLFAVCYDRKSGERVYSGAAYLEEKA